MKLFLVQHAKAASKEIDPERPLTEKGFNDIKKIAAFIKPLNLKVDYLWHSGKKRAQQTAEVLDDVINTTNDIAAQNCLAPNDDISTIKEKIISNQQDTMIVGHLPFLSKLASMLLTGSESLEIVAFKQAGILCLDCSDENQWQLDWIITPEIMI